MKDIPHHMKKLNRQVIRSARREEIEEKLPEVPTYPVTKREERKKAKIKMRDETQAKPHSGPTPEERNKIMKSGRVPIFDRTNNAKPKHARASKKKTPRI